MNNENLPDPEDSGLTFRKTSTIYAVQMKREFKVRTLEGVMSGKKNDWLAKGIHGELYPIDAEVFAKTYEEVPDPKCKKSQNGKHRWKDAVFGSEDGRVCSLCDACEVKDFEWIPFGVLSR